MKLDAIAAIEAAYEPAGTREAWLSRLLETLAPVDRGRGLYAMILDASDPGRIQMTPVAMLRPDEAFVSRGLAANAGMDPTIARALFWRSPPVTLASASLRRHLPGEGSSAAAFRSVIDPGDDILGVFAVDHDDRGVFLGVPTAGGRAFGPGTVHALTRIAAHVTSAWRLRELAGPPAPGEPGDAVLAPSGAVLHASGAARGAGERAHLAEAVKRMERARGKARRTDPSDAVELWRALVSGRFSLVDHVDTDGRRFVLARRNEPGTREPRALSGLERHVAAYAAQGRSNKHIAYLLGLPASTAASLLASALRKLGVRSRVELIRAFGGGAGA